MSSSGIFDTIFFKNAIPLINENTPFSTFQMLAINQSSIIQGYSFYEYQQACGIQDTSTILTNVSTNINYNISTIQAKTLSSISYLSSNINFIGKTYYSTIEYSSGQDFSLTGNNQLYTIKITAPTIDLGSTFSQLINTNKFNLYVDFYYSLFLSTSRDNFTWVNTLGSLNTLDDPELLYGNKGSYNTTRVGNNAYTTIRSSLLFNPIQTQMPANITNFQLQLELVSTINARSRIGPYFDIYIPAKNNFKFTLVPI